MTNILIITGPTAVGKTLTAVEVARTLNGEVVSADSRQVYRRLDIGSSKPSQQELREAKHYLVDVKEPFEEYSSGEFARDAEILVRSIAARGKVPIVCGGATLYITALTDGLFQEPDNRLERMIVRKELQELVREKGIHHLYEKLQEVDPVTANRIEGKDTQRTIRALEVYYSTGVPLSTWHGGAVEKPDVNSLSFCLFLEREELARRIERRTGEMIRMGLAAEVKSLLEEGLDENTGPLKSVGYSEMAGHLRGDYSLEEAERLINKNTRRYAKRQLTWFRKMHNLKWIRSDRGAVKVICDEWHRWIKKAG